MIATKDLYASYVTTMRRIADVRFANAALQWDQETGMPPKGAAFRGQQLSTLSEIAHGLFSAEKLGAELEALLDRNDLSETERRNVERTQEDYLRNKKYSSAFVRRLSEQTHKTFHSWIEARKQNSFGVFQTDLDALVALKKEETDLLGYEGHCYNALLDEFEKGATVPWLDSLFDNMLPQLKALLDRIVAAGPANDDFLRGHFPKAKQWEWSLELIKGLGFDFEAGRQDISEHPFSVSFSAQDVRITTRVDESDFGNMTWSCIHETGHGLYEQGLPVASYGLPLGEACSYSIHESQSRLWENNVGRGKAFWQHWFPKLVSYFPEQWNKLDPADFYKGINKVQPSLVRTEADEITYHFHVYIRYTVEKALIEGSLNTKDIPAFWKEQYQKWLGVQVPDDKQGALQDVHWSHGSFGYFPTYSLGSFYAAQFYAQAKMDLPGLRDSIAGGNTGVLLQWLREKIHSKGRFYRSDDLCKAVTAQSLNTQYFVTYLDRKYSELYGLM